MDQPDDNIELWALFSNWEHYQFDLLILHKLFLGFKPYMKHAILLWPGGFPYITVVFPNPNTESALVQLQQHDGMFHLGFEAEE
ncbi:hypothetical protein DSO57_1023289 [Entomophthora muscae]|uniref:Uncharacterized protein n=1 Tax=Entomophthora muscae TaxID=34485 RepID=A0ACC2SFT1_9FUNG|nr:hypothetical protein DSO57_1023289 [Entomophthora muscae]